MKILIATLIVVVLLLLFLSSTNTGAPEVCGDMTIAAQGETVAQVASRCGTTVAGILALNPNITDPNNLPPGLVIHLPVDNDQALTSSAKVIPTQPIPVTGDQPYPAPTLYPLLPETGADLSSSGQEANPSNGSVISYTIQPGDTLGDIAEKDNTTVQSLLALNPEIKDPNLIYPGTAIEIQKP